MIKKSFVNKDMSWAQLIAYAIVILGLGFGILSFQAWLLMVVLGWFGVHVLTFWKAVVAVLLVSALFGASRR